MQLVFIERLLQVADCWPASLNQSAFADIILAAGISYVSKCLMASNNLNVGDLFLILFISFFIFFEYSSDLFLLYLPLLAT